MNPRPSGLIIAAVKDIEEKAFIQLKVKETWPTKRASAVIMAINADTFSPSTSQDAPEITLFTILELFFSLQVPIVLVRKLIRLKVYTMNHPDCAKVSL